MNISGYTLFRRDRLCRKGGGVAIYVRRSYTTSEWSSVPALEPKYELLWVKVMKDANTTFIGALYHPCSCVYQASVLLDHILSAVLKIQHEYPASHVILAGDLNKLSDNEVVIRTGLTPIVSQPTRGCSILDRVYIHIMAYSTVASRSSSLQ